MRRGADGQARKDKGASMTEREYIDATNLAKIRAAKAILLDVLPMTAWEEGALCDARGPLCRFEDLLTRAVKTKEETS